jgi:hypothetical protein
MRRRWTVFRNIAAADRGAAMAAVLRPCGHRKNREHDKKSGE